MNFETGELDHISDVLSQLHSGHWYTWANNIKNYDNLRILDPDKQSPENKKIHGTWPLEKPSKKFLEDKLVELEAERKAAMQAISENKLSAKTKLENLGLTADEIKDTFNI